MAKERMGPLAPAICVLWETAENTWQRSFALFVAVKPCGRSIIKGNWFYTSSSMLLQFVSLYFSFFSLFAVTADERFAFLAVTPTTVEKCIFENLRML